MIFIQMIIVNELCSLIIWLIYSSDEYWW